MKHSAGPDEDSEEDRVRAWYDRHIISAAVAFGCFFIGGVVAYVLNSRSAGLLGTLVASPLLMLSAPGLQSAHAPKGKSSTRGATFVGLLLIAIGLAVGVLAIWNGVQELRRGLALTM